MTRFIDALMSMRRLTYLSGGVPGLLLSAGSGAVFLVGGMRVIDHTITMGTLVAFIAYQMRLVWPIQALMGLYASLASARVSLRAREARFSMRRSDVVESPDAVALPTVRGRITLERRRRSRSDAAAPVLDRVSLDVSRRRTSGDRRAQRRRQVDDRRPPRSAARSAQRTRPARRRRPPLGASRRRSAPRARRRPGAVRVSTRRSPRTFGMRGPTATDDECQRRGRCGRSRAAARPVCRTGSTRARASAGARCRPANGSALAIARAFLADPAVLVLDEATGALDPATEAQVATGYEAVMARSHDDHHHAPSGARAPRRSRASCSSAAASSRRERPRRCWDSGLVLRRTSFRRAHWRKRTSACGSRSTDAPFAGRTGRGVTVALLDSGVHGDHPHVGGVRGGASFSRGPTPTISSIASATERRLPRRSAKKVPPSISLRRGSSTGNWRRTSTCSRARFAGRRMKARS